MLMSAGAYIAGAYFGAAFPGAIEMLHEAFQYAVAMNPFSDPVSQITALYEGAQYQAAAALHAVGDWFQGVGAEVSQRLREQIDQARAFLGPTLDQAKSLFVETWRPVTEGAAALRDQIRNAIPSGETILSWTQEIAKAAYEVASAAAEAYGVYEFTKKVYGRLLSKAKKEVREQTAPAPGETGAVTERTINLNLNTAIGGGSVADAALRSREIRIRDRVDPTAGLSALDRDQIIWVSDRLGRRMSNDLSALIAETGPDRGRISIRSPSPDRLEDPLDPIEDLRHRARFPVINWEESALSADRLDRMRPGRRIGSDLRTPKGLEDFKLIVARDGTLQVERDRPSAPSPDIMM